MIRKIKLKLLNWLQKTGDNVNDYYTDSYPTEDSAIQIFKDQWNSKIPGSGEGSRSLFEDIRITWAIDKMGGVEGKKVLELGPLEAGHTFMVHNAGAGLITSIEANSLAYLKCLTVKECFHLDKANFLFGDFMKYIEGTDEKFDCIFASGVLYHLLEPLKAIDCLSRLSNKIYLWTHYADLNAMPIDDPRYTAGITGQEDMEYEGYQYKAYRRTYGVIPDDKKFCGGIYASPIWLEKNTILDRLHFNGFSTEIEHDEDNHQGGGPACSIYAFK